MKRHGLVLAAAAPGGLGVGAPSIPIVGGMTQRERRESRFKQMARAAVYRKTGPGWTNAQVQRMAAKKRNQARNRRAHRG